MTLRVLGAGFGRTGTMSLKSALETLGLGPCHHMIEVINGSDDAVDLWLDAFQGRGVNWQALYHGYQSAVDWPTVFFLPELIKVYPKAKIILTERDVHSWYQSASKTIFKAIGTIHSDYVPRHQRLAYDMIIDGVFAGRVGEPDYVKGVFNEHVNWVINTVPDERLLKVDLNKGWAPLCNFLHKAQPSDAFPRENVYADFKRRFL